MDNLSRWASSPTQLVEHNLTKKTRIATGYEQQIQQEKILTINLHPLHGLREVSMKFMTMAYLKS